VKKNRVAKMATTVYEMEKDVDGPYVIKKIILFRKLQRLSTSMRLPYWFYHFGTEKKDTT